MWNCEVMDNSPELEKHHYVEADINIQFLSLHNVDTEITMGLSTFNIFIV
jgi:hypothetical protein